MYTIYATHTPSTLVKVRLTTLYHNSSIYDYLYTMYVLITSTWESICNLHQYYIYTITIKNIYTIVHSRATHSWNM